MIENLRIAERHLLMDINILSSAEKEDRTFNASRQELKDTIAISKKVNELVSSLLNVQSMCNEVLIYGKDNPEIWKSAKRLPEVEDQMINYFHSVCGYAFKGDAMGPDHQYKWIKTLRKDIEKIRTFANEKDYKGILSTLK